MSLAAPIRRGWIGDPQLALVSCLLAAVIKVASIWALVVGSQGGLLELSTRWDAGWFISIAQQGYLTPDAGGQGAGNLAFFPLLPLLARALTWFGLSAAWSVVVVAWIGSLAALLALYVLGEYVGGPRVGLLLTLSWATAPRSMVLGLGYAEGWYVAWTALVLLMLLRGRWWSAAAFTILAGLTRPSASALIATCAFAAVAHWWRRGPAAGQALAASVVGASGFLAYLAYVDWRMGSWDGYLKVQEQWKSALGSPVSTLETVTSTLAHGLGRNAIHTWVVALVIVLYLLLLLVMIVTRENRLLTIYTGLAILLVLCVTGPYFHSKARLLLPAFPALFPLACWLSRRSRVVAISVLLVWLAANLYVDILIAQGKGSP